MTDRIRVLIVDDHLMVRRGLATFLRSARDLELVGEATDGAQAIGMCEKTRPDVVLMDLKMPQLAMPVRVLVMGTAQTPSLDAVLALSLRQDVLDRLRKA